MDWACHRITLQENYCSQVITQETDCTEALYLQIQAYQHNQKNIISIQLVVTA